jgi:hypothetical protein
MKRKLLYTALVLFFITLAIYLTTSWLYGLSDVANGMKDRVDDSTKLVQKSSLVELCVDKYKKRPNFDSGYNGIFREERIDKIKEKIWFPSHAFLKKRSDFTESFEVKSSMFNQLDGYEVLRDRYENPYDDEFRVTKVYAAGGIVGGIKVDDYHSGTFNSWNFYERVNDSLQTLIGNSFHRSIERENQKEGFYKGARKVWMTQKGDLLMIEKFESKTRIVLMAYPFVKKLGIERFEIR